MMGPSKAAQQQATSELKARFVVDGVVDSAAIASHCKAEAARLWTGRHIVYKSEQDMAAGFEREITSRVTEMKE